MYTFLKPSSMFYLLAVIGSIPFTIGKPYVSGPIVARDGSDPLPNATLTSEFFTHVQGKLKGGTDQGWGGYGYAEWSYTFGQPGNYLAEDLTVTYFDDNGGIGAWMESVMYGSETPTGTIPVSCHMTATAALTESVGPTFTVVRTAPWVTPTSAGGVSASCAPSAA